MLHQEPSRWDGAVQSDGSLGSTTLLLGLYADATVGPLTVGLSVKSPVYIHLVEGPGHGELTYPVIFGLSLSMLFGADP